LRGRLVKPGATNESRQDELRGLERRATDPGERGTHDTLRQRDYVSEYGSLLRRHETRSTPGRRYGQSSQTQAGRIHLLNADGRLRDLEWRGGLPAARATLFQRLDRVHSVDDFAEDRVLAIEPRRGDERE